MLDLYEQPYDADYPVVCLDESPKQLLDHEQFTTSTGQRYRDSEYVRRGVVELFVATEPLRGWRCLRVGADHKAAMWVQFVARQMDTTYCKAKKVRWVMDNPSTHKLSFFYAHFPPAVALAWLRRMEIIYIPAHGSWLNMAEIEFSALSRQVLNQPFTTGEQVHHVVQQWQDRQNARPKPRNWQFKTADARIKLAELYPTQ
ncbi:IS630 family transposase [Hymenobacter nivis]|uniref:IS630 family transposase n=1 Tax=Hymenobacter nivis TaxID=1850093 RepID=A0A2Z3GPA7_9BACT|nr:IS630 family transposase [Hymenobacter nivis]AWM33507.1 IS630 family transposase [Hymenobacter nivis]